MSKKVVDTPIYIDTYKLVGVVYNLRFAIPKRDRAVLGDRLLDAVTAMLVEFTLSYKLRGNEKVAHTDMRNVTERFRREVLTSFRRYLQWNGRKNCFALRARYGFRAVLRRKYKVRL